MNNNSSRHCFTICFIILIGLCFLNSSMLVENTKPDKAILIRATLNGSEYILMKDSLNIVDSCIKITIDTINVNKIKKIRNKNGQFKYNGREYYYSQLFDYSMYNQNSKYFIKSFVLSCSCVSEMIIVKNEGNCFGENAMNRIRLYNNIIKKNKSNTRKRLFIENILLKRENGQEARLNAIIIDVLK